MSLERIKIVVKRRYISRGSGIIAERFESYMWAM